MKDFKLLDVYLTHLSDNLLDKLVVPILDLFFGLWNRDFLFFFWFWRFLLDMSYCALKGLFIHIFKLEVLWNRCVITSIWVNWIHIHFLLFLFQFDGWSRLIPSKFYLLVILSNRNIRIIHWIWPTGLKLLD